MPQQSSKGKSAIVRTGKVQKVKAGANKNVKSSDKEKSKTSDKSEKDLFLKKLVDSFNRLNSENAAKTVLTPAKKANKNKTLTKPVTDDSAVAIKEEGQSENLLATQNVAKEPIVKAVKDEEQYHAENCKCRDKQTRRCHRCERPSCDCKEPVLRLLNNLEKDPIFGQEGASYAKFGLGGCYICHSIQLKITICVQDRWMPIHRKEFLKTNCQGNFSIKLPPFVTDLLVVVKLIIKECDKLCLKCPESLTRDTVANKEGSTNGETKTECVSIRYIGSDTGYSVLSYLEGNELNLFQLCKSCSNHALLMSAKDLSGVNEQLGPQNSLSSPCRASRAMAIVQLCVFESIIAITGSYKSLYGIVPITQKHGNIEVSLEAAIIQTVYQALLYLFPSQQELCESHLAESLEFLDDLNSVARSRGIDIGRQVAKIVIDNRNTDGSNHIEQRIGPPSISDSYVTSLEPGTWLMDPVSKIPVALGSRWAELVKPFVLESASQFRASPPPHLGSKQYAMAFNEVKSLGGDGITTPTIRSQDATEIGIFWSYDGAIDVGTREQVSRFAPPRLYNQIAMQLAVQMQLGPLEYARMLALINIGMADACLACWESKYFYKFWRPVTAIRRANDSQTKPEDKNPDITPDPSFIPLGAPASNSLSVNGTPPFPAYPSGHSALASTVFEILRQIFQTDNVQFRFVSDEYNGNTKDNQGNVRPYRPRSFHSLSQAEEENGQSRIFLGINWNFDKTEGVTMGRKVGKYIMNRIYTTKLI